MGSASIVASSDGLIEVVLADLARVTISEGGTGDGIARVCGIYKDRESIGCCSNTADAGYFAWWSLDFLDAKSPLAKGPAIITADAFTDRQARELTVVGDLESDMLTCRFWLVERWHPVV